MQFTKMHGAGNDYIYVDCIRQAAPPQPEQVARAVSDRHRGIGGDGLILICPSEAADVRMRMFNADGSEAEMCGNGIRCLAKYVYERGICRRPVIRVETGNGVLQTELEIVDDRVRQVRVDMGIPVLEAARIPTRLAPDPARGDGAVVDRRMEIAGRQFQVTCVSMGNPHCVIFVERATDEWVMEFGPRIETDDHFPARVNVEFVEVLSPTEVRQRTWERGSGETLACGTGASAVCVAGVLTGRTQRQIVNHLLGGDLRLDWPRDDGPVWMTGPAVEVFSGEWIPDKGRQLTEV